MAVERRRSPGGAGHLGRWRTSDTVRMSGVLLLILAVAGSPAGLAGSTPGRPPVRAYVSNEFGGDITVIETGADRIIGRVPVGPAGTARPRGMALSPDGRMLYAAVTDATYGQNEAGRQWQFIAAIDVAAGKIKTRYRCGSDPERLAVSPDGRRLYCSNEDAAGMSIMDVATGKVIATVRTGIEPEGIGISPDGRWVYVASETSNTVTVIETRHDTSVRNILVPGRPRIAEFAPDGGRVYVTSETAGTLTVLDATRQAAAKTIALGSDSKPVGIAVAPDGRTVYVAGGRCNCIAVVDSRAFAVSYVVQRMGRRPWGVAVTPDGKRVYTANGRSDDVTVIDTGSREVIRTIDRVGRGPHSVVIGR